MRVAYATFVRNWITIRRAYPWSFFLGGLISGLISIVLAYITYTALAGSEVGLTFITYAGTSDYMTYIILGLCIYLLSVNILLGISRSLITERREGTLEALFLTPIHRRAYFAGVTAQWCITCFLEVSIMLIVAYPLGINLEQVDFLTLILTIPVFIFGLFSMAIIMGAIMLASGDTYIVQNTLFATMALIGGFSFPIEYLPSPLQWAGALLPITGTLRILRAAILQGTPFMYVFADIIMYTLLSMIYTVVGFNMIRWAERRVLEGKV